MVYQSLPDIPPHEESNPEALNAIYCIHYSILCCAILFYYSELQYIIIIIHYSIL